MRIRMRGIRFPSLGLRRDRADLVIVHIITGRRSEASSVSGMRKSQIGMHRAQPIGVMDAMYFSARQAARSRDSTACDSVAVLNVTNMLRW